MEKTEIPGIYKAREGVLINTDNTALSAYKKRKMQLKSIDRLEKEMTELRSYVTEVRQDINGLREMLAEALRRK
jgi:peptidoglycan hydrolase CwlO-like protein